MKKVLSVMIALTTILSVLAVNSFNASAANYNPSAALDYAEDNWDNGIELCAGFVSNCIQAGGINIMERSVGNLYNALKGTYGTAYVLIFTLRIMPASFRRAIPYSTIVTAANPSSMRSFAATAMTADE